MRWISVEPDAWGVVAVGQTARGVIAIGQWAWGVVAIGQFAFGGVAVGMLAVGGVTVGLGSVGLYGAAGLAGAGGRGRGPWVASLLPQLPRPRRVPIPAPRAEPGRWIALELELDGDGDVRPVADGASGLRLDARLRRAAADAAPAAVLGRVRSAPDGPVVDELRALPERVDARGGLVIAAKLVALGGVAAIVWLAAVQPWLSLLPL